MATLYKFSFPPTPGLPNAPTQYDRAYHDRLNSDLRIYMNQMQAILGPRLTQPTVVGSRASGAALVSLLEKLEEIGLIVDGTTA